MTDLDLIASLSDAEVVALTLWGEARGETHTGRAAIAHVIDNRVKAGQFGKSARAVCLKHRQFSCWSPDGGKENYGSLIAAARSIKAGHALGPALLDCMAIVDTLSSIPDLTSGATHYMTRQQFETNPKWAAGLTPCARIGSHVFFKDVA